jgi:hypothetical protein
MKHYGEKPKLIFKDWVYEIVSVLAALNFMLVVYGILKFYNVDGTDCAIWLLLSLWPAKLVQDMVERIFFGGR